MMNEGKETIRDELGLQPPYDGIAFWSLFAVSLLIMRTVYRMLFGSSVCVPVIMQ